MSLFDSYLGAFLTDALTNHIHLVANVEVLYGLLFLAFCANFFHNKNLRRHYSSGD